MTWDLKRLTSRVRLRVAKLNARWQITGRVVTASYVALAILYIVQAIQAGQSNKYTYSAIYGTAALLYVAVALFHEFSHHETIHSLSKLEDNHSDTYLNIYDEFEKLYERDKATLLHLARRVDALEKRDEWEKIK